MRGHPSFLPSALATLTCAILAGCTAREAPTAAHHTTSPATRAAASNPQLTGRRGSPGNPLILSCAQEAFPGYPGPPISPHPQPGDLVIGPLFIVHGERLATANPAGYGDHGQYKIPFIVTMGWTVTVTIAAPARGHVVIDIPNHRATSVTYHSCAHKQGFFAQGFAFTHGQTRGCVPLDVTIGHRSQVHRVMLSLFARNCPP